MRKVLFKRFIAPIWVHRTTKEEKKAVSRMGFSRPVDWDKKQDTGVWEEEYTHHGYFHNWGYSSEILDSNQVDYSTFAIIELLDGTIEEVLPTNIKFITPPKVDGLQTIIANLEGGSKIKVYDVHGDYDRLEDK